MKIPRLSRSVRSILRLAFIVLPATLLWLWMGNVPQRSSMNPRGMLSQMYLLAVIVWVVVRASAPKTTKEA